MKTILRPCPTLRFLILTVCALLAGPLRAEDEIEKAFRDALYAEEVKGDIESALKAYQEVGQKFETQRDMAATALFRQAECLRKLGRKDEAAALYNKVLAQYGDKERVAKLSRENLTALGQAVAPSVSPGTPAGMTEEEAKELTRLKVLAENSPDLLDREVQVQGGSVGVNAPPPLDRAAERGQAAVVAWLLSNLPNPSPERLAKPLDSACRNGHLKVCELLLDAGADPNKGGPLVAAIQNQRAAVARLLLARKADPNQKGPVKASNVSWALEAAGYKSRVSLEQRRFGEGTPLFAAMSVNLPPDVISELIKAGADVNAAVMVSDDAQQSNASATPYPVTPLGIAILQRDTAKVELLLAAKAGVNHVCNDIGATPLLVALSLRAYLQTTPADDAAADAVIGQLVAAGADWKIPLTNGVTALHLAAKGGNGRWVEAALQAGLDVHAADKKGHTPLHYAAWGAAPDAVRLLLAAGAKVNALAKDANRQFTPLFMACHGEKETPARVETLKLLLDAGGDPNLGEPASGRPLSLLLPQGDSSRHESIRLLVEKGARPRDSSVNWDKPPDGWTPSEAALDVFRIVWKAAHRRDNPRLPHAVWLDDGETPLRGGGKPVFSPQFCDDSALTSPPPLRHFLSKAWWLLEAHPNIRRDWTKVSVTRLKDGKEEVIVVDVLALIAKSEEKPLQGQQVQVQSPHMDGDFALQWGDAVSIPKTEDTDPAPSGRVKAWCREDRVVKVRIEFPGGGLLTNAVAGGEPLWISTTPSGGGYPSISIERLLVEAGIPAAQLSLTVKQKHMNEAGIMEALPQPLTAAWHGDILTVEPPEPHTKMAENALRSGVWLCQSMDGPFWEVPLLKDVETNAAPLGSLLLALLSPHPLPVQPFDWDKALVRHWKAGGEEPAATPSQLPGKWEEEKLLTLWPDWSVMAGTILILPPAASDTWKPPAVVREALTKKLSLIWHLDIGHRSVMESPWEPRFFRAENKDGHRVWRDLDPGKSGSPVLPVLGNLLLVHPKAAEFKITPEAIITYPAGGSWPLEDFSGLLTKTGTQLFVEPPPPPPPPTRISPESGTPRRRIVLPTENQ